MIAITFVYNYCVWIVIYISWAFALYCRVSYNNWIVFATYVYHLAFLVPPRTKRPIKNEISSQQQWTKAQARAFGGLSKGYLRVGLSMIPNAGNGVFLSVRDKNGYRRYWADGSYVTTVTNEDDPSIGFQRGTLEEYNAYRAAHPEFHNPCVFIAANRVQVGRHNLRAMKTGDGVGGFIYDKLGISEGAVNCHWYVDGKKSNTWYFCLTKEIGEDFFRAFPMAEEVELITEYGDEYWGANQA